MDLFVFDAFSSLMAKLVAPLGFVPEDCVLLVELLVFDELLVSRASLLNAGSVAASAAV